MKLFPVQFCRGLFRVLLVLEVELDAKKVEFDMLAAGVL
jgi:hypothetical protein